MPIAAGMSISKHHIAETTRHWRMLGYKMQHNGNVTTRLATAAIVNSSVIATRLPTPCNGNIIIA